MNFSLQEYRTIVFGAWLWTGLVDFEGFAPGIGGVNFVQNFGYFYDRS